MTGLNWEFIESRDGGYQTAEYRGLRIEAHRDESPMNPFTEWDFEPALVASGDRWMNDYSDKAAFDPFAGLPDIWFSRNWRAIAKAFSITEESADADARDRAKDWDCTLTEARADIFRTYLDDALPSSDGMGFSDASELLASLWRLRGVEALTASSRGYSQSDWAELLIVATPQWAEQCGAPRNTHAKQLQAARDLYSAWAWGDVYGFIVKGPNGEDLESIGDSVWGYYGTDHDKSGLEQSATDAADSILAEFASKRGDRLKTLIRQRVPLHIRPSILSAIAPAISL